MTRAAQAVIAYEVFDACLQEYETFGGCDGIGAPLAYLLGAILDPDEDAFVDWSPEFDCPAVPTLRAFMKRKFPATHVVWRFIQCATPQTEDEKA